MCQIAFVVGIVIGALGFGAPLALEEVRELSPQFADMVQLATLPHAAKFGIVTLATQRQYLLPAYALATSIRATRSSLPLIALLSHELAHDAMRNLTIAGFHFVHVVERIDNPARALDPDAVKQQTGRAIQPHKMDVFTKFRVFQMTGFDRLLFLDADTIVVSNVDHLLYQHESYGVVPSLVHRHECDDKGEESHQFYFK